MIDRSDNWGPFSPAISHAERVARLRALLAIVLMSNKHRPSPLADALALAENGDMAELQTALVELNRLPAKWRRGVECSYIGVQAYRQRRGKKPMQLEGGG
jgi:hypothetical protein